jgi:hypothetical protein
MKRCPKCNLDYFDNMLEFCLEDGAKLIAFPNTRPIAPTVTQANPPGASTDKTVAFNSPDEPKKAQMETPGRIENRTVQNENVNKNLLTENIAEPGLKVLEIAPLVLSLAHNWWQWIYLNNQYYSSVAGFLLSANFLMWLLLLLAGAVTGLLAVRYIRNKGFAYTSLVILAINLLLFLVPRR